MYQERQSGERSPVSERGDLGRLGGAGMVMGEFPGMEEVLMSNNSAPITSANPEVVKQDLVMFEETEIVDDEEVEFHISAPTGVSVGPPSPVSTRHGPLEPEKGIQEEQPHQPEKKNNDVDEVEEHLQHSSLGSTLQQTDQNLQQTQENLSQERQIDLDIDTEENTSAPVSLAISNEIHSPSFPSELTEESTQSHLAPETTPALASSGASEAAGLGFSVSAATIALSAGYKKKQDSKEQQEALKAQEDAKIEELKKTIAELQRQELEIIQSIRGVGTPSEIISRRIQQLHEYNEIKDVGQVILGKCAELEGTTIKKQYENFGLDTDD
ncbi:hypothetical protein FBU30_003531 [Linnemannia zychae]|nr:hypothetical protein FBU30_003531 [Linnemannia zychae]